MSAWYHVVLSHRSRDPIAPTEAERLRVVRRVVRAAGRWLVLWCLVDDHLHLVLACEARRAGITARSVAQALSSPLAPAWIKEVCGRSYRRWLVDYLLLQVQKHGLSCHPALWSGSCFLDLVGARWLPPFNRGLLLQAMPRLRLRELMGIVGLDARPLELAWPERIRALGAEGLVRASFSALGALPDPKSKEPTQVLARTLACVAAERAGLRLVDVADVLGGHPTSARRLAKRSVPERAWTALDRRVALEDRVLAAGAPRLDQPVASRQGAIVAG